MTEIEIGNCVRGVKDIVTAGTCEASEIIDALVGIAWGEEDAGEINRWISFNHELPMNKAEQELANLRDVASVSLKYKEEYRFIIDTLVNNKFVASELVEHIRAIAKYKQ